ncbi:DUF4145 domain-containing protein [Nostoc sp. FACHB-110]|uniref:DUF4145 domain-containing protein n=1 Tax=Nostoc sp. FACHB-110 TaxID=2692834 RepID=UPI0016842598|nr:DUF4145 domain-containing protein [Nostoc sp. FACHB-110]MBD2436581.1 HEAT repeat domain-containing protein [Nostoc sp. FACHB-110]
MMKSKKDKLTQWPIRCEHCGNKTLMEIISEGDYQKYTYVDSDGSDYEGLNYEINTYCCPNCKQFNIVQYYQKFDFYSEENIEQYGWNAQYLYPYRKEFADSSNEAKNIKDIYRDAEISFKIELYSLSVIACRKTVELLCSYFDNEQSQSYNLVRKLAIMRDKGIIDNKLYDWAYFLRIFGNEAVHTNKKFSKEDAKDILDFTYVLVEYCIDFDYKFTKLLERRGKSKPLLDNNVNTLTEEVVNILVQSLNAGEASVRYYAASTLAQINLELDKIIPVLLNLTDRTKFSPNAINCLKSIGLNAIPELIKALETNSSHNVRAAAATILGDLGNNNIDVMTSLVKSLKDTNDEVQYKAAMALEKIGVDAIITFAQNV